MIVLFTQCISVYHILKRPANDFFAIKEAKAFLDHGRCHACRRLIHEKFYWNFLLKQKLLYILSVIGLYNLIRRDDSKNIWILVSLVIKVLFKTLFLPQLRKKQSQESLLDSHIFCFKGQFDTIQYKTPSVCVNKEWHIIILWYIYDAPELFVWFYF